MNFYKRSTQVPNKLFDNYLHLSEKELKVLLVVIRQTRGWIGPNGQRKQRDWISQRFFANRTGLSRKSVSLSINLLVSKGLIVATSPEGALLKKAKDRKGLSRIYYGCGNQLVTYSHKTKEKSTQEPITNSSNTKLTLTKMKTTPKNWKPIGDFLRSNEVKRPHSDSQ